MLSQAAFQPRIRAAASSLRLMHPNPAMARFAPRCRSKFLAGIPGKVPNDRFLCHKANEQNCDGAGGSCAFEWPGARAVRSKREARSAGGKCTVPFLEAQACHVYLTKASVHFLALCSVTVKLLHDLGSLDKYVVIQVRFICPRSPSSHFVCDFSSLKSAPLPL